jgi:hypothetical protein
MAQTHHRGENMRALLLSFLFVALVPFTAHADTVGNFGFAMASGGSKASGCVHLTSAGVTSIFPNLPNGKVTAINFYYGQGDVATVTQSSQFVTTQLITDSQGQMSISPVEFCGLAPGHYNFKYGLTDATGAVLEFMADADFNAQANSVDVN